MLENSMGKLSKCFHMTGFIPPPLSSDSSQTQQTNANVPTSTISRLHFLHFKIHHPFHPKMR